MNPLRTYTVFGKKKEKKKSMKESVPSFGSKLR